MYVAHLLIDVGHTDLTYLLLAAEGEASYQIAADGINDYKD